MRTKTITPQEELKSDMIEHEDLVVSRYIFLKETKYESYVVFIAHRIET